MLGESVWPSFFSPFCDSHREGEGDPPFPNITGKERESAVFFLRVSLQERGKRRGEGEVVLVFAYPIKKKKKKEEKKADTLAAGRGEGGGEEKRRHSLWRPPPAW